MYDDGSKFVGDFKNGKRNGLGVYYSPNGTCCLGSFVENTKHGIMKLYSSTGEEIRSDLYANGVLQTEAFRIKTCNLLDDLRDWALR